MTTWTRSWIIFGLLALAGCGGDGDSKAPKEAEKSAPPPKPIALDTSPKTGQQLYKIHCLACHGEEGGGVPEIFPPLTGSARLTSPKYFVHGLIHGFPPPSDPDGSPWMGEMPNFQQLSDEDLAKLTNYVRQRWGGATDEITVEMVAEQRTNP